MYTVYHNPRCKKSRAGLQYVIDKGMDHRVREYLKDPLTKDELSKLVMKLNIKPEELVRTQEEYYRRELKGLKLNDQGNGGKSEADQETHYGRKIQSGHRGPGGEY